MERPYQSEHRIVRGRNVRIHWYEDTDMRPPWAIHDGHGVIRQSRGVHRQEHGDKHPCERPLNDPDRNHRQFYYDWQATMIRAREEGWGLGVDGFMALTAKLRRCPTARQVTEAAVERDFKYCSGWLTDEWRWCGIEVVDDETEVSRSIWGVESDADAYHNNLIEELVEEMYQEVVEQMIVQAA